MLTFGRIPEWPKGTDCKSAGDAFEGSNPSPSILFHLYKRNGVTIRPAWRNRQTHRTYNPAGLILPYRFDPGRRHINFGKRLSFIRQSFLF